MVELDRFVLSMLSSNEKDSSNPLDLLGGDKFLDVGCGKGTWGMMIRSNCIKEVFCIGIDLSLANLQFCRHHRVYNDVILADARKLPFRSESFDITVASEILEHLAKEEGRSMLFELEDISRIVVTTTPNGFLETGDEGLETHLSGWHADELRRLGYTVHGVGFRYYKNRAFHWPLGPALFYLVTPIAFLFPSLGAWLVARKILSGATSREFIADSTRVAHT